MNEQASQQEPKLPSSGRLIATLAGISVLSGLLVVLAFQLTLPRIMQNKKEALERAVFKVLPGAVSKSNFQLNEAGLTALTDEQMSEANLFAGYGEDGALVGLAMEASARGYQDIVKVLYGFVPSSDCIIGFTVLQSTETPGLGDKVDSDPGFLANFQCLEARVNEDGSAMRNEIITVKNGKKTQPWEIEGISGATVTSTAVGKALRESTNKMLPLLARYGGQFKESP